jgi:predicted ATP-grasp superfamily ATP-dependent carboligase
LDKVLVLGASAVQLPLIHELRERGFYIYAVSNIAEDKACKEVDEFHLISSANFPKIKELIETENIINVFSIGSDVALRTSTKLAAHFSWANHPTPEEFENLHNKAKVREILKEQGTSKIHYKSAKEYSSDLFDFDEHEQWVIKPVDGYGSKGIYFIEEYHDKEKYFKLALAASIDREVIVEPFIEGRQLTIEFFITNDSKLLSMMTIEKQNNVSFVPYLYKVNDSSDYIRRLNHIAESLGLKTGIYNADLVETDTGLELMDIAPRLGGNHLALLYKHSFEANSVADYINYILEGTPFEKRKPTKNTGLYILHSEKKGTVTAINDKINFVDVIAKDVWVTVGSEVKALTQGNQQQGYIIFEHDKKETLEELDVLFNEADIIQVKEH